MTFETKDKEIEYLGQMLGATREEDTDRLKTIGARLVELSGHETAAETDKHMGLLGLKVEDKVTGFKGVVSSISFDLYGCVQTIVTPFVDKDGKAGDGRWFDVTRLTISDHTPVMNLPDFSKGYVAEGKKGPAEKPAM